MEPPTLKMVLHVFLALDNKINDLPTHCSLKPIKLCSKIGSELYHLAHLKLKRPERSSLVFYIAIIQNVEGQFMSDM